MREEIKISDYDYDLPEERIAKFPLERRDASRLLVSRTGKLSQTHFSEIGGILPEGAMLVFNNTKVIRARIIMHKPSGARIEVFCLEPHAPADYERAFAVKGACEWKCIVGNSKKWKDGALEISFRYVDNGGGGGGGKTGVEVNDGDKSGDRYVGHKLLAYRAGGDVVRFEWDADLTFGQLLELLGRIPIPPYLGRESVDSDNRRYQTVYSKFEGSVAAPTAGLHFTPELIEELHGNGFTTDEITLHVGAGTFLPVKSDSVIQHHMHTEHFEVTDRFLDDLIAHADNVVAVGTTTVRTLESLAGLGFRVMRDGSPDESRPVAQWELYEIPDTLSGAVLLSQLLTYMRTRGMARLKAATQVMIMPGYRFRVAGAIVTNFHQPKSTLLLLVSAFVGEHWREIYRYALDNDFRFLSYGDSSILIR